jgi:hypothetical protein
MYEYPNYAVAIWVAVAGVVRTFPFYLRKKGENFITWNVKRFLYWWRGEAAPGGPEGTPQLRKG